MKNEFTTIPPAPHALKDHMTAVQNFFKGSLKDGQHALNMQIAGLRVNVSEAGSRLNALVLPVNNFLKDLAQIDHEFQQESIKENTQHMLPQMQSVAKGEYYICLNGRQVPADKVLTMPMEENY